MKRVFILGQPGSGKSTLARYIGDTIGLPVVHGDRIRHLPGWVVRDEEERRSLALAEQSKPEWVFEGYLPETFTDFCDRAHLIVWLDMPLKLRLWRTVRRSIEYYGRTRPDVPDNCPESISAVFLIKLILMHRMANTRFSELKSAYQTRVPFFHLRSRVAVASFMSDLDAGHVSGHVPAHEHLSDH